MKTVLLPAEVPSSSSTIHLALRYANLGWPVLPLHTPIPNNGCSCNRKDCHSIGKHPRTFKGLKDASKDPGIIEWWWSQWGDANIGIITGGQAGLVVVDVDPRHDGDRSWEAWSESHSIPNTLKSLTGGGGFHLFFQTDKIIKNKTGLLPGVDIRAEGGYVVAPGSTHASQKQYVWETDPSHCTIAPLPKSLEDLILDLPKATPSKAKAILSGTRNTVLTSVAGLLRKHGIDEGGILTTLSAINQSSCSTPLEERELGLIAKSIGKYPSQKVNEVDWMEPHTLSSPQSHVASLHQDLIPEILKPWICDIAERMQVPLEFLAAPVITSLSSIIGRQIGIYPKQKDDWFVIPNLWGAIVARPGYFKSPAIAEAMKPLDELIKKARVEFESGKTLVKAKEEVLKAKIDGLKDSIKKSTRKGNEHDIDSLRQDLESVLKELDNNVIFERRYKTNDATTEKLACLLNENPKGLLVLRDELSGWLKTMQKSGREGDREFYLEAWNGYGSFSVDRIGRGSLHVPALCLSVFGGLQPSKLESYIDISTNGSHDDGLLQRFQILVFPEVSKRWKNFDKKPNQDAFATAKEVFQALACLNIKHADEDKIPGLHFSKEAQELFNEWRESLELRLRSNEICSHSFESHLSKYRSLVPSLALIFYLISIEGRQIDINSDLVDSDCLTKAIKWSQFLESHAQRVYANTLFPGALSAKALADKILNKDVMDRMPLRSIYRNHWSLINTVEKLESAVAHLERLNWVKVEMIKGIGKAAECIRINPALFEPSFNLKK